VSSYGDRRTATVEDFNTDQLAFFAEIATTITDPEIRTRISDVLRIRQRDYRHAELAIASYLESAAMLKIPLTGMLRSTDLNERFSYPYSLVAILNRLQPSSAILSLFLTG